MVLLCRVCWISMARIAYTPPLCEHCPLWLCGGVRVAPLLCVEECCLSLAFALHFTWCVSDVILLIDVFSDYILIVCFCFTLLCMCYVALFCSCAMCTVLTCYVALSYFSGALCTLHCAVLHFALGSMINPPFFCLVSAMLHFVYSYAVLHYLFLCYVALCIMCYAALYATVYFRYCQ